MSDRLDRSRALLRYAPATRVSLVTLVLIITASTATIHASPNLSLEHPAYEVLDRHVAVGELQPFLGGFHPVTVARIRQLLRSVGESDASLPAETSGMWVSPLHLFRTSTMLAREEPRAYSTPLRARDIAGELALSCERTEGRPCGAGFGVYSELEAAAGYDEWIAGVLRLRTGLGTREHEATLELDRLYLAGAAGPVAYEAGRDALELGAHARTNLAWGRNAPPLDHVRLSTRHPLAVTPWLHASGHYVVGRASAPQRYPDNLVALVRGQLDVARSLELGVMQMLQLGGRGAPSLGVVDFLLEHVRRGDRSAGETDTSNRRFGFDATAYIPELGGLRFYYQLMFEDIRKARFIDALRYDADHLVGVDVAALGRQRRHGFVVEWHETGYRSHEHTARTTGFTTGGRVVGSPLGPDASSVYVAARLGFGDVTLRPWLELIELASDRYTSVEYGPIIREPSGVDEDRWRLGTNVRFALNARVMLELESWYERVEDFGFVTGDTRTNAGISAVVSWYPRAMLGTLNKE